MNQKVFWPKKLAIVFIFGGFALGPLSGSTWATLQEGHKAYKNGDYARAFKEWHPLAAKGEAIAQYNLGRLYYKGKGVTQDYSEAKKWYRLAAEQGHASAQNNLGSLYFHGHGVPQDDQTAVRWYRLAADQGQREAQNSLSYYYFHGKGGVAKDFVQSYMWASLAAAQGAESADKKVRTLERKMTVTQVEEARRMVRKQGRVASTTPSYSESSTASSSSSSSIGSSNDWAEEQARKRKAREARRQEKELERIAQMQQMGRGSQQQLLDTIKKRKQHLQEQTSRQEQEFLATPIVMDGPWSTCLDLDVPERSSLGVKQIKIKNHCDRTVIIRRFCGAMGMRPLRNSEDEMTFSPTKGGPARNNACSCPKGRNEC